MSENHRRPLAGQMNFLERKPPSEREGKIMRSVIARLRYRFGVMLFRRNVGAIKKGDHFVRFGAPGQADLWGFLPASHGARHVEIEVKRPGNEPTDLQLRWLREVNRLGGVAYWGDDVNTIERIMEAVMGGGRIVWLDGVDFDVEM